MKTTQTLTPAEFGKLVKRSRERIGQLVREDRLPVSASGRLDLAVALPAFVALLDERLAAKTGSDERIKAARAEKLELANEATKRDLIPADEVRREVTRAFQELKTQLLIIPRRLGQPLALETDAVAVEEKIHSEIVSALESQRIKELQAET
jgi:hypothetical protein